MEKLPLVTWWQKIIQSIPVLISVDNFIYSSTSLELVIKDWEKYIGNGINAK